ncbi:MAG TPA: hypothetical protein VHO72_12715 [Bacteroidales bacterium]|nr:hypothetical protein [Bacteroidales bacterium]
MDNNTETSKPKSATNNIWTGTAIGLIVPFAVVFVFFKLKFPQHTIEYIIDYSLQMRALPKIISLCVIPNLGIFFLFMKINYLFSARGIILSTFIMTLFVLVLKMFF